MPPPGSPTKVFVLPTHVQFLLQVLGTSDPLPDLEAMFIAPTASNVSSPAPTFSVSPCSMGLGRGGHRCIPLETSRLQVGGWVASHRTLVGPLPCVHQVVLLQVGELGEALEAQDTLEWTFPAVHPQVDLHQVWEKSGQLPRVKAPQRTSWPLNSLASLPPPRLPLLLLWPCRGR